VPELYRNNLWFCLIARLTPRKTNIMGVIFIDKCRMLGYNSK
jgi:hypothetical protein